MVTLVFVVPLQKQCRQGLEPVVDWLKISQSKSLSKTLVRAMGWRPPFVVRENNAFTEHPASIFFLIKLQSLCSISQWTSDVAVVPGAINSVKVPLWSQNMYLTAGGSGEDSVHVSSVITPTLRSENVWWQAFSNIKRYLLLLSMRVVAMTCFVLPTNRRLISKLPSYFLQRQP